MALDATNIVPLTHYVKATDVKQFYDLLTGAMTDQPVTLANTLILSKASGSGLTVAANAGVAGTLTVLGDTALGTVATGALLATTIDATEIDAVGGPLRSLVDGALGGLMAGVAADVLLYRSAADTWRTPDSLTVDAALVAGSVAARKATTAYPANGALAISDGLAKLTKAGVNAMTLADPAAGDDGTVMVISAATANAHTVTNAGSGFNSGGGASDVATFGGAIGDYLMVFASGSRWWVLANRNVTLA